MPKDCPEIGKTLATLRIYLTGRICDRIRRDTRRRARPCRAAGETRVRLSRQRTAAAGDKGRIDLGRLARHAAARNRDARSAPFSASCARRLKKAAVTRADVVEVRSGTIQMRLPPDVWIDLEHAGKFDRRSRRRPALRRRAPGMEPCRCARHHRAGVRFCQARKPPGSKRGAPGSARYSSAACTSSRRSRRSTASMHSPCNTPRRLSISNHFRRPDTAT